MPEDGATYRRQWRWYVSHQTGRRVALEEFKELAVHGQAALMAAIKRHQRGESLPSEVKALPDSGGLREIRVQVGHDPFRAIFFQDSPVHDICVLAIYKNQRKLPKSDRELAMRRMNDWRTSSGASSRNPRLR